MKSLYLTLAAAMVLPCAADISIGTGRRPVAPQEQPAAQPDLTAEKADLIEAIKLMTDEKGAAAAEKQLNAKKAAVEGVAKKYDETVKKIDALGPQVESQLQKEVSRVSDMAAGKGLATDRDKKMHAVLMQNIPESGYDASGAHDIGGDKAPTPRKEKTPPPLRPLPPELQ